MKVEVDVLAPDSNKPNVSVDVKQHFINRERQRLRQTDRQTDREA